MPMWKRCWLAAGGVALTSAGLIMGASSVGAADERADAAYNSSSNAGQPRESQARPGQTSAGQTSAGPASAGQAVAGRLSEAELGNLIRAMGINVKLDERRYDFAFKAIYNKSDWSLSMSAVLSENGNSVWVIAWLDECPKSAAEVPRTALLGLLEKNDTMGNGKFFAYIPGNNRFVLQRVVPNEGMTTARFREILQDLGTTVVETYPRWSVAGWKRPERARTAEAQSPAESRTHAAPTATSAPDSAAGGQGSGQRAGYRSQD